MKYTGFHARNFEAQVEKALAVVQTILDTNRAPKLAADIQEHEYDDKFALSGFLTNTAIASLWNIFERMGLTPDMLQELCQQVQTEKRAVTMRFQAEDTCSFLKETTVDVVTFETQHETETTSTSASFFTTSSKESTKNKVISKVKEYHWKIGMNYTLTIFAGPNPNKNTIQLQARSSSTTVVTTGTKEAIFPDKTIHSPHDINITWFFQQLKQTTPKKDDAAAVVGPTCNFSIDRSLDECKTPVRNPDVKAALKFFQAVSQWSTHVSNHFKRRIERQILGKHNPAAPGTKPRNDGLANLSTRDVFCPVLPLLEDPEGRDMPGTATRQENARSLLVITSPSTNATSPLLSLGDINKFLNEQVRSLDAALTDLSKTFAPQQLMKLITMQEASLTMLCLANVALFNNFYNSIYYIEDMLKKQLIAAIGKEVQPKDFNEYMKFHFGNLFDEQFAPKPFCYAIRQPKAFPDGLLTIEPPTEGAEPIQTMVRHLPADDDASSITGPLKIPINAATTIDMTGDRYLHGWIQHRFESSSPNPAPFQLSARARQFSSFLLMVGVMAGPNQFNPKEAIILQNKDEVLIPLLLNELPTAKDFRDAISSLSPEQQRFAKAFRGMQLESSVFGVCVVQLKPQLEVLLGLPAGALTKEIRLTQDLMSLFVDYQIPSDLLSFDGDVSTSTRSETIEAVRGHVKSVMDVIEEAKESQLKEEAQKSRMTVTKMFSSRSSETSSTTDVIVPTRNGSLEELRESIQRLETREARVTEQIAAKTKEAKSKMRRGDKKGAVFEMKRSKVLEAERDRIQSMKMTFECQVMNIEAQTCNASVARALDRSKLPSLPSEARTEDVILNEDDMLYEMEAELGVSTCLLAATVKKSMTDVDAARQAKEAEDLRMLEAELAGLDEDKGLQNRLSDLDSSLDSQKHQKATDGKDATGQRFRRDESTTEKTESSTRKTRTKLDITKIPRQLDSMFEQFDTDNASRATIIKTDKNWSRKRTVSLLSKTTTKTVLRLETTKSETNKAFDLLDALSRSGSLPIRCSELHVVVAVTHYFENDVMGTVIQENINPIQKAERSSLLVASTIHGVENPGDLVRDDAETRRLSMSFPTLLG